MPLRIVIPCCTHDQHQAIRLIKWIAELGKVDAKGVLHCARDCKVSEMMELMGQAFTETKYLEDAENIKSDWSAPHNNPKSAEGPNSLFKQVSWYFSLRDQNPWLFLEPDAYPVRKDWYELMSKEWDLAVKEGKQFVGAQVASPGSDVPTHMSGVAIYHPQTPSISESAVNNGKIAFDIAGAPDFMKRARFTKAIVHKFRGPEFDSQRDLDKHCPEGTVCYHASKSGSILHWLRLRLGMAPVGDGAPGPIAIQTPVERTLPADRWEPGMVCDIYIKTFAKDFPWLKWCLQSIQKFATGFRRVVIQTSDELKSEEFHDILSDNRIDMVIDHRGPELEPGYLWQQACKLNAHRLTDADYILYMDSDCVFTRDVRPRDFIVEGKSKWRVTPFENARDDQSVWIGPMEKFTGRRPTHECMREHPHIVPRWALEELQKFCDYRHGCSIEEYVMAQAVQHSPLALTFSEWNCLGWFLFCHHHEKFIWVEDKDATPCTYQGWTHDGGSQLEEDIAKFREILGSAPEPIPDPQKPVQTISEQIRTHVEALKAIVMESKVGRTQMLHQELRAAGLLGAAQVRKNRELVSA